MSDEFRIARELAEEMVQFCIEGRPNEACGMLAAKAGEVVKVFLMANASNSPVRYSLEPSEQLAVYNTLDEVDRLVTGVRRAVDFFGRG